MACFAGFINWILSILYFSCEAAKMRGDLNSAVEESSASQCVEKPEKTFSFTFFAASREKNRLSGSAPTLDVIR
jgi:hypothetical protein